MKFINLAPKLFNANHFFSLLFCQNVLLAVDFLVLMSICNKVTMKF